MKKFVAFLILVVGCGGSVTDAGDAGDAAAPRCVSLTSNGAAPLCASPGVDCGACPDACSIGGEPGTCMPRVLPAPTSCYEPADPFKAYPCGGADAADCSSCPSFCTVPGFNSAAGTCN